MLCEKLIVIRDVLMYWWYKVWVLGDSII